MIMPATLPDSCFCSDTGAMPFEKARSAVMALGWPLGRPDMVPLADAVGRVLAAAIEAPCAIPPFDQAAMDGYAISVTGRRGVPLVLPVAGRTRAGDPQGVLAPGAAHRIMTGAALPKGADTVVMQEQTTRRGDLVQFAFDAAPGAHIRRAGEDVRQGASVLRPGCMIGWPEIALLAAIGIDRVPVARRVRIAVVTTGSELCKAGEPLADGAIYDSNGPLLAALLREPNTDVVLSTVHDDTTAIARVLEDSARSADLIVTTAGMSVGEEDHVRNAISRAGGQLEIVKVAMKPGKPLAIGKVGEACFVGLPGNPQAAAFGALAFARPVIGTLLGRTPARSITAELAFMCSRKADRTELVPVRLTVEQGRLTASRSGPDGSHRMMPMVSADAIAIMPGASTPAEPGMPVEVLPFSHGCFGG
ncbi:gephyrin-like molybdotransferase Glp [Mesorhizobium sp.]|uniref:molybdopterin molybdotransferase MoeA n=1 Tax=Mesorhizobium sp. TaxID=1871066 RepID=UPI000FE3D3DC|nr:gephyrin-like molybdotransferase Glp [Mesorhizobium sp.]RWG80713.1 MAG: molybdopterin molybdenumtransferase MoeA [Mesorhizobium sp.]RWK14972.1 MAG: molybdopterin molybdenumtransferase MoeA [Mesorhizobium sp.]TIQ46301.1 MAG: molybdopterin molybdotransferase MoeA [Mesorhizobium sp.]TIQ55761.1 MAG: molybdopterin molybdotransferase MoeA [Mesorhizobium sp.]